MYRQGGESRATITKPLYDTNSSVSLSGACRKVSLEKPRPRPVPEDEDEELEEEKNKLFEMYRVSSTESCEDDGRGSTFLPEINRSGMTSSLSPVEKVIKVYTLVVYSGVEIVCN